MTTLTQRIKSLEAKQEELNKELAALKSEAEAAAPKLTAEERFLQILKQIKRVEVFDEAYPDHIVYLDVDGKHLFDVDVKNGYLWCNYDHVWVIFYNEYSMDYGQTQAIIKGKMGEYFKWNGVTPYPERSHGMPSMGEHFKWNK